jgi:hypothetical protein
MGRLENWPLPNPHGTDIAGRPAKLTPTVNKSAKYSFGTPSGALKFVPKSGCASRSQARTGEEGESKKSQPSKADLKSLSINRLTLEA